MITQNLKEHLLTLHSNRLDFNSLVVFMENSETEFIGCTLTNSIGLANLGKVYIDISQFDDKPIELIFYVILHEYCHTLRITKMGKSKMVEYLSSDDWDEFLNHILGEEILADKFASIMYFRFNHTVAPYNLSQRLDLEEKKEAFSKVIRPLFGVVKNNEETYDAIMNSYIIT